MSVWTLTLRQNIDQRVDASAIRLADWIEMSAKEVERTPLNVGRRTACLADLFTIKHQTSDKQQLVIEGDLHRFDRIGDRHRTGCIRIAGSVGNHAGASMSGGRLTIEGDAGDYLAAPHGSARQGIKGGRITVGGSAGNYVGHRMRRGEILINGNAENFLASQMFAGTIIVAGRLGDGTAIGMRRGTVVAARFPEFPIDRFSKANRMRSVFPRLIETFADQDSSFADSMAQVRQLIDKIATDGFASRRGDRAVSGKGEVLAPVEQIEVE